MADKARSLYRRHRPRTFADVVGQEAVVRTLRNAVSRGQVHHAYLFVGSRGTGKTSMAKILAASLNCESGPTVDPCGRCDSCRAIAGATSLDVIEMDAASNNSVEDIRELRESVSFAPVSGRHKVYILDEAHMLSQAAWNAFLKTLEEPPANTVFVLATTEAQKVPATVIDRCHRFDFQRPTMEQLASVLERVASAEQISIPREAVAAIARSATGSFRDALGTLEQLVTYSGEDVALADVLAVLGIADEQLIADAFDAVGAGDARAALLAVARCVDGGRDAAAFVRDLEGRARELLVVQTLGRVPPELSLTTDRDERLSAQAQRLSAAEVVRTLDLLGAAMEAVRAGAEPRTQLELALVKAAAPQADGSTRALLARIERLEQALAGGAPVDVAPAPTPTVPLRAPAPAAADAEEPNSSEGDKPQIGSEAQMGSGAQGGDKPPEGSEPQMGGEPSEGGEPQMGGEHLRTDEISGRSGDVEDMWPALLEAVRGEHALLGAALAEAAPTVLENGDLELAFGASAAFHKRTAESPANRRILVDALKRLAGRPYNIAFELRADLLEEEKPNEDGTLGEEDIVARLMAELDAEELHEEQMTRQKGE